MTRNEALMLIAAYRYEVEDGDELAISRLRRLAFDDFDDLFSASDRSDAQLHRLSSLVDVIYFLEDEV